MSEHYTTASGDQFCRECGYVIGAQTWDTTCKPDSPCYCCLAAEVEVLRAQVARLRNARHGTGQYPWHCPACEELHRALDGATLEAPQKP